MGMLNDLAALARAGYSLAELKEVLKMAGQSETQTRDQPPSQTDDQSDSQSDSQSDGQLEKPTDSQENNQIVENGEKNVDNLLERIAGLEKQLTEAQAQNIHRDTKNEQDEKRDIIADIVRDYM